MTPQREAIAEKIIQAHKVNNAGILDWQPYFAGNNGLDYARFEAIRMFLKKKGLIRAYFGNKTILTAGGWDWISFENERKNEAKAKRRALTDSLFSGKRKVIRCISFILAGLLSLASIYKGKKMGKKQKPGQLNKHSGRIIPISKRYRNNDRSKKHR